LSATFSIENSFRLCNFEQTRGTFHAARAAQREGFKIEMHEETEPFWVRISGEYMVPRFHAGTLIYVDPAKEIESLEELTTPEEPQYGIWTGELETPENPLVLVLPVDETDARLYFGALIAIDGDDNFIIRQDSNPNIIKLAVYEWRCLPVQRIRPVVGNLIDDKLVRGVLTADQRARMEAAA
jgi:hypothetical protein